ncbi:TPA: hypothetical protein DCW38_04340 [candidate division WOR-3 bacterium]|uniref:Cache domain-containing protein n=1 Tax=candidate division WOR-3 bacterium TaxID=2052148 RepID=A0A350HA26_UNCW3|nr:hypothetical protein [candidate division WOR-3 bacterium]
MKRLSQKNFFLLFLIICFLILAVIGIVHLISTIYVGNTVYENHRNLTEKLIRTAENGISHYLFEIQNDLLNISKKSEIEYFGKNGENVIKNFQQSNQYLYQNVTRVDKTGKIFYTYPEDKKLIGKDVLYQEHNKKLFKDKTSVISRPFVAVQGYKAIAIAVPVFRGNDFDGAVTGLIPFDRIWDLYVKHVKPTENSFVIVANQDGGIIYSPEYMSKYDNVNQMMEIFRYEDSLTFDTTADYTLRRISIIKDINKEIKSSRFSLVKSSLEIGDNVWYILVYTPDNDIKKIYQLVFKTQTIFAYLIIFLLIFTGMSFVSILNQKIEEKNRLVQEIFEEKRLSEGEKNFLENIIKSIVKVEGLYLFVLKGGGEIVFHNQHDLSTNNLYDLVDSAKKNSVKESLDFIYEKNRVTAMMIELKISEKFTNILFNISSFTFNEEKFIVLMGFEYMRIKDVSIISDIFADSFKKWFTHEKTLCFIDNNGKVIASNRLFQRKFGGADSIKNLGGNENILSVENAIKEIFENVNEVTLDLQAENNLYRMTFIPIINEFLKVEYIAVEIN